MSNIYDEQLDRMKTLMSYGVNEATARESQSVVEYKTEGADGKTYGIIREGQKFYIKAAPKKDTEVIAEDFDYIGGFMNKKNYQGKKKNGIQNYILQPRVNVLLQCA